MMRLKKSELNKLLGKNNVASFWKRLAAYIIDSFVIMLIISPFRNKLNIFYAENVFSMAFNDLRSILLVSMMVSVISLIYWVSLEYKMGQTAGKYIMNIQVVSTTRNVDFLQILIRNITQISLPLLIIDTIFIFNSNGQRYTERLSNTRVMEK